MKQAEDKYTMDLLGESLTTQDTQPSKFRFRFYVRTTDGATTEWTGLTAKRAKDMYAYTSQSQPSNVTAFGWEELK
jgi:hypothetical protein